MFSAAKFWLSAVRSVLGGLLRRTKTVLMFPPSISTSDSKDRLRDLIEACRLGNVGEARRYLQNRALLNEQDVSGDTPLIAAVKAAEVEIVRYLMEQGARLDVLCHARMSPLDHARQVRDAVGRREIMTLLGGDR